MIHFFNRKELLITWNLQELSMVRDILASSGMGYRVITRRTARDTGRRTGSVGLRQDAMYQYYVYVKKEDHEKARYLIQR